ncbi:MAG: hypothetical protein ACLPJH_16555 [Myxococcaceae bacterium]
MRHLSKLILACALITGCATPPAGPPPKWLSQAQDAVAAAQAAGAGQVPAAQEHLQKAQAALAAAQSGKGDPQTKAALATAEAQLAGNLAKQAKVQADLQTATNQLNALKAQ